MRKPHSSQPGTFMCHWGRQVDELKLCKSEHLLNNNSWDTKADADLIYLSNLMKGTPSEHNSEMLRKSDHVLANGNQNPWHPVWVTMICRVRLEPCQKKMMLTEQLNELMVYSMHKSRLFPQFFPTRICKRGFRDAKNLIQPTSGLYNNPKDKVHFFCFWMM